MVFQKLGLKGWILTYMIQFVVLIIFSTFFLNSIEEKPLREIAKISVQNPLFWCTFFMIISPNIAWLIVRRN